ncbi:hypothetical protein ACU11_00395 [Xanthomonas oryzae pv. oryzicola]|nr:hypothetical protein ACU11_00395 [Xanthomonas oryzae pv. oryzicola]PUE92358.1 hypothetical protein C7T79_15745 [Xanthomonas oryzae pv. oryzicola]
MTPTLRAWFEPASWSPEKTYDLIQKVTHTLGQVHPSLRQWRDMQQAAKDKTAEFSDRETVLTRIRQGIARAQQAYPTMPHVDSAELNVTNAVGSIKWQKPGCAIVSFKPWAGEVSLEMFDADLEGTIGPTAARKIFSQFLKAILDMLSPSFAATDVQSVRDEEEVIYQLDKKLFPHRQYFGWMGFVPTELSHAQIRDADEMIAVPGKGTIIVTVPGLFDPTDAAQVEQVHRVEMQLAHYNLLRVTDPDVRDAP